MSQPSTPPSGVALRLFGGFALLVDAVPFTLSSQGSRSLLAYIATHPDGPHNRSLLVGLIWPELPEATARRRLSHALWEIGRILPQADCLIRRGDVIGINRDMRWEVDLWRFEQA